MTTLAHDAFVELFRSDGVLLKELLAERYGLGELEPQVLSPELTQLPSEYRADSVTMFVDAGGVKRFAVIVEVQHSRDDDKQFTWPAYLCATRARHRCPTLLLVLARDPLIAQRARALIDLGHPGFTLTPIVITPEEIPPIKDLDTARRFPRLAVLSALSHPSLETAAVALAVLDQMSADYLEVYRDMIVADLSQPEQELLEAMMEQHYEWRSIKAKRQIAELKAESRQEGRQEGRVLASQDLAIRFAKAKLGELSAEEEARIRQLADEEQLIQLIVELSAATSQAAAKQVLP